MRGAVIAFAAGYVVLAHLAVETTSPALTVASLALLAVPALAPKLARGSLAAWGVAILTCAALALLASRKWVWLPLYAPSVCGDAFMAWVFGHTLAAGRIPLIERMVRRLHGAPDEPVQPDIARYARSLTAAWAVLFAALGTISLALALCAEPNGILPLLDVVPPVSVPQSAWSWFANVAEYGIAAGFFIAEYLYRRRRFPQQPYSGLVDFTRRLGAIAPRLIGDNRVAGSPGRSDRAPGIGRALE